MCAMHYAKMTETREIRHLFWSKVVKLVGNEM